MTKFINLPASKFQKSTIRFCARTPALLAKPPNNPQLAAAVQTLCATPPGLTPTTAQITALSAALSAALSQLVNGK